MQAVTKQVNLVAPSRDTPNPNQLTENVVLYSGGEPLDLPGLSSSGGGNITAYDVSTPATTVIKTVEGPINVGELYVLTFEFGINATPTLRWVTDPEGPSYSSPVNFGIESNTYRAINIPAGSVMLGYLSATRFEVLW